MTSVDSLARQVVELTSSCWADDFVALYAYGGFAGDEMDEWSDLDVCLVWKRSDEALAACRTWMTRVYNMFGFKVDPNQASTDHMGKDAPWEFSFMLRALRENSKLLLGEDVRALVAMPTEHKLRLSVSQPGLVWVRLLYSIPREKPVPASLPLPDVSPDREFPGGNVAWGMANTVTQLLRVIALLETGVFHEEKRLLPAGLQQRGEQRLAGYAADALRLRTEVPRFGPLTEVPPSLERLSAAIPELAARVLRDLDERGLVDPSYEPDGRSLYLPDGTRRDYRQA